MNRSELFERLRPLKEDRRFSVEDVVLIDEVADALGMARLESPTLTVRGMGELVGHEAIVQEAYKDSEGVWTWSVGITAYSGLDVAQYKDNPQPIAVCLAAFVDRVRRRYLPAVMNAFNGHTLSEAQIAAALSFHFNTGAIERADWVSLWKAGKVAEARIAFMNWRKPAAIISRREKERDLFFDGEWSGNGTALVIPVSKPSYQPAFSKAKRVDITQALKEAMR